MFDAPEPAPVPVTGAPEHAGARPRADAEPGGQREPKYWRLKRHLVEELRALPPGSPVPTERALAAEFGVSRTTVRQALAELTAEGRVQRVQGKGTFVAAPKLAQRLQLSSYSRDVLAQGRRPASQLLEVTEQPAGQDLSALLGTSPDGTVLQLRRLRTADGEPVAIETTHLPLSRFGGLRARVQQDGSLYRVLHGRYGVEFDHAEETIETALATPEEADLLGSETGLPMLLLFRHSFDTAGRPVEWVRSIYRGDRYKLTARIHPPG